MAEIATGRKRILVFGSTFLDSGVANPANESIGKRLLEQAVAMSSTPCRIEYRCDRNPREPLDSKDFQDVVAVIADLEQYDAHFLASVGRTSGGSLALIARYGVGYDNVDCKAATEHGVIVTNAPGSNTLPTAELAVSTILDVAGRRVQFHNMAKGQLSHEKLTRLDVYNRTLGIIGVGAIGKAVVELFKGFQSNVLLYSAYRDHKWATTNNATYTTMETLCSQSDIISLHAAGNRQLIGKAELSLMKKTCVLVNCARGCLVDSREVYLAVKDERLWGYGADDSWPEANPELDGLNIILSPHVGADTDSGRMNMQRMTATAVFAFLQNKLPHSVVNSEVLSAFDWL